MASSVISETRYVQRTYSVDCTTFIQSQNLYAGLLDLVDAPELVGAKAIIPLFARKAGNVPIVNVAFENTAIRVTHPISLQGVNVGLLFIY